MANEENLIPFDKRTKSEQREIQSKGGKASGAARRRKRTMRQAASMLLDLSLDEGESEFVAKLKPRLLAFGVSEKDATYQDVMLASILLKAIKGDVRAAEFVRDIAGESPYLALKKQELNLRKIELKFRQEQEARRTAAGDNGEVQKENNLFAAIAAAAEGDIDENGIPELQFPSEDDNDMVGEAEVPDL